MNRDRAAAWMQVFADAVHSNVAQLTELDTAVGDADHGINLERGMTAVMALRPKECGSSAAYLTQVGLTLASAMGGASGTLFGTFFLRLAEALPDDDRTDTQAFGRALRAGLEGVMQRGQALPGDSTLVDALLPAVEAYDRQCACGADIGTALEAAAHAASVGSAATAGMIPRKGRARCLGERAVGHVDPGSFSMALLMDAAARTMRPEEPQVKELA